MKRRTWVAAGAVLAIVVVIGAVVVGLGRSGSSDSTQPAPSTTVVPDSVVAGEVTDADVARFAATPSCESDPVPPAPAAGEVVIGAFVVSGGCVTTAYTVVGEADVADRLAEVRSDPTTISATVDQEVFTASTVSGEGGVRPNQWYLDRLAVPTAWAWSRGAGVKVGVVDFNPAATHPDLSANVTYSRMFGSGVGDDHGTHVAGIVAAADNGIGVVGVAPDAQLVTVGALSSELPTVVSGAAGIRRAVDAGAQVLNLSWFAAADRDYGYGPLETSLRYAAQRDVLVVMAAGNCGAVTAPTGKCPQSSGTVYTPQSWVYDAKPWTTGMLVVGATDSSDHLAGFSSYAREPSLAAPGVGIWSATADGAYGSLNGTSMASPIVAGVGAIVRSAQPALSAPQVAQALRASAAPLADVVPGSAGAGLVDPVAALVATAGPMPCSPQALWIAARDKMGIDPNDPGYESLRRYESGPPGVYGIRCFGDWATGSVSMPNTGTTDANDVFRRDGNRWAYAGDGGTPGVSCRLAQMGMPADLVDQVLPPDQRYAEGEFLECGVPLPTTTTSTRAAAPVGNFTCSAESDLQILVGKWAQVMGPMDVYADHPDFWTLGRPAVQELVNACGKAEAELVANSITGRTYRAMDAMLQTM